MDNTSIFKKAIAIDGNCLMYRCFYATYKQLDYFKKNNYTPINALNLFVYSIVKLLANTNYEYGLIAFDFGKKTFRNDKYENYKQGRKPMPEELRVQLDKIKASPLYMGISSLEMQNYEADDLIGSFAKIMNKNNIKVDIYTADKDMLQTVNELTSIKMIKRGLSDVEDITSINFAEKIMNLQPCQIPDFKGISGDNSDALKGINGIGPKTASSLLIKYSNLDGIYNNLNSLNPNLKIKMEDGKQSAYMCKEIATLCYDLLEGREIESFLIKEINLNKLEEFSKNNNLFTVKNYINSLKGAK